MINVLVGWFVVLKFNAILVGHIMAVGDANVFPGFLTPVLTQLFSTGDRTHIHQVKNPTRSPLSHPGGADD